MAKLKAKALITGGAGFIGSHLSEALPKRGWDVTIIDDLSTGSFKNIEPLARNPRFQVTIDSIAKETMMDRPVSECDLVFRLAAAVGVQFDRAGHRSLSRRQSGSSGAPITFNSFLGDPGTRSF